MRTLLDWNLIINQNQQRGNTTIYYETYYILSIASKHSFKNQKKKIKKNCKYFG
jgi:hypothetical protein